MRNLSILTSVVFGFSTIEAHATITTFSDRDAFESALGSATVTEDSFDNNIPNAQSITFDSGVVSQNTSNLSSLENLVSEGRYRNGLSRSNPYASETNTWTFPSEIMGVGFDVNDAGPQGVQVTIDEGFGPQTFLLSTLIGGPNGWGPKGFVGFVSSNSFLKITFSAVSDGGDVYFFDNLVFASAEVSEVPLPAAFPLFVAGLACFGGLSWKREKSERKN
jgi:hypothetical protein